MPGATDREVHELGATDRELRAWPAFLDRHTLYGYHHIENGEFWTRFPPLPEEFQAHEQRLATLIESEFGFTRLDKDVLLTPVPDLMPYIANFALGEARLIDCLFDTEHPDE